MYVFVQCRGKGIISNIAAYLNYLPGMTLLPCPARITGYATYPLRAAVATRSRAPVPWFNPPIHACSSRPSTGHLASRVTKASVARWFVNWRPSLHGIALLQCKLPWQSSCIGELRAGPPTLRLCCFCYTHISLGVADAGPQQLQYNPQALQ